MAKATLEKGRRKWRGRRGRCDGPFGVRREVRCFFCLARVHFPHRILATERSGRGVRNAGGGGGRSRRWQCTLLVPRRSVFFSTFLLPFARRRTGRGRGECGSKRRALRPLLSLARRGPIGGRVRGHLRRGCTHKAFSSDTTPWDGLYPTRRRRPAATVTAEVFLGRTSSVLHCPLTFAPSRRYGKRRSGREIRIQWRSKRSGSARGGPSSLPFKAGRREFLPFLLSMPFIFFIV